MPCVCLTQHHSMIWKLVPNSHLGIFLGYSRSLEILHYYDTKSALVKTASQGPFDEVMNDLAATPPPNMQILWQLNNKGSLAQMRSICCLWTCRFPTTPLIVSMNSRLPSFVTTIAHFRNLRAPHSKASIHLRNCTAPHICGLH